MATAPKRAAAARPGFKFDKSLRLQFTTPKGRTRYTWLNTPDTKFKPLGEFKTDLILSLAEAQPLIDAIEELKADAIAFYIETVKKKPKIGEFNPYKMVVDEAGAETGEVAFSWKTSAVRTTPQGVVSDRKLTIIDSKKQPCAKNVGAGSIVRIGGSAFPYYTALAGLGISLSLDVVQVVELVEFAQRTYEFQEEEGGYEETETPTAHSATESEEGADGTGM